MCENCSNQLLPKDLKSCPKSNKSPNLVTLARSSSIQILKRRLTNFLKIKFDLLFEKYLSFFLHKNAFKVG